MVEVHAHFLGHDLHLRLHVVLHAAAPAEPLPRLAPPPQRVAREQDDAEHDVAAQIAGPLAPAQLAALDERAAGPGAGDLDAVDGRAEELVVALHDAQVAADEQQLLGQPVLVAQDLADHRAALLLHLVAAPLAVRLGELVDVRLHAVRAARVGPHQRGRGEQLAAAAADAPLLRDRADGGVVELEQRRPEARVLVPEARRHVDVEAVVDQHQLGAPAGLPADEDVAGMGIAVHPAPEEHLGWEQVDHGGHDLSETEPQSALPIRAEPGVARRLDMLLVWLFPLAFLNWCRAWRIKRRAATAWASLATPAQPRTRQSVLVPQSHSLDPLGRHDAFGAEFVVDLGYVYAASQTRLRRH